MIYYDIVTNRAPFYEHLDHQIMTVLDGNMSHVSAVFTPKLDDIRFHLMFFFFFPIQILNPIAFMYTILNSYMKEVEENVEIAGSSLFFLFYWYKCILVCEMTIILPIKNVSINDQIILIVIILSLYAIVLLQY